MTKKKLASLLEKNGFEILSINKKIFINSSLSFIINDNISDVAIKLEKLIPDNYDVEYTRCYTAVISRKVNILKNKFISYR